MKLLKHLANLGYGSRKEVKRFLAAGAVTDSSGRILTENDSTPHEQVRYRGEELDSPSPLVIILNKPDDFTCSSQDSGDTIYDLLPPRFAHRNPGLNSIGRLDKDTTGLLLMTDDGKLLHRIIHPKSGCLKVYHAHLARSLEGHEAELFSSGNLILHNETKPLLPAKIQVLSDKEALITLHEGRYHQVRRMFAAAGNHVLALKRTSIGGLVLPEDLAEGEWRELSKEELGLVFQ